MTEQIFPNNINALEADRLRAKLILSNSNNYIVRYLRHDPTVGLGILPTRNADGAIIEDAPPIRKRVICAGVPYACMIAFTHQEKLLIGWSKRLETRQLLETPDLHGLFRKVLEDTKGVSESSDNYQDSFDIFCQSLMSVLSYSPKKDIEISFSKASGKIAAIIRALNDSININGRFLRSEASGPIPGEIAKNLPQFIKFVEQTYGDKAANVSIAGQEVAKHVSGAITAV